MKNCILLVFDMKNCIYCVWKIQFLKLENKRMKTHNLWHYNENTKKDSKNLKGCVCLNI